ncbi:MAG: hypothetical protein BWX86_02273 [Verrucomicrobia bacterium ADurb.Bin122]|nr:MAG: hypothetical protein BWX86_02273 [Verrucomicrobia bacterium ADurb.Bin122]
MPHEGGHEGLPFGVVLRRGDIATPPENRLRAAGHPAGHEPELHKRLHPDAVDEVEELVDVLPVIDRLSLAILLIDAHVVAEQPVETDIPEAALLAHEAQLALPVGAQPLVGPACADAKVVHSVHRAGLGAEVGGDRAQGVGRWCGIGRCRRLCHGGSAADQGRKQAGRKGKSWEVHEGFFVGSRCARLSGPGTKVENETPLRLRGRSGSR